MKLLILKCQRALSCAIASTTLILSASPAHAEQAGIQRWSFDYHGTTVPVIVWYPTDQAAQQIDGGPFTLNAKPDAPLPGKPLPLVLISHGTGGSNTGHHPLAQALAGNNYIVAALTHPGDNYQDRSLAGDSRYFNERPNQLVAMLDALLADPKWGATIDQKKIGAIGHSIGGYTVAAMVGARPDLQTLYKHCTTVKDDPSCAYKDPSIAVSSPSASPYKLSGKVSVQIAQPDRRVRSIALLAPMGSVVAPNTMTDIKASVLMIGAQHDEILPAKYHFDRLTNELPSAQSSIAQGAGHFSFLAPINPSFKVGLGEVAKDPDGLDRSAFNQRLGKQLVNWFNQTL